MNRRLKRIVYPLGYVLAGLLAPSIASCGSDSDDDAKKKTGPDDDPPGGTPANWDPSGTPGECNLDALLPVRSYAAKVKVLLTGLPLDDAELTSIEADPTSLGAMIDQWQQTPQAEDRMRKFFETAFQQSGLEDDTKSYLFARTTGNFGRFSNPTSPNLQILLNDNFQEAFARTAVELVKQGRPFNEVVTTDSLMVTTAHAMVLAYLDDDIADDEGDHTVRTSTEMDQVTFVADPAAAPPLAQALNPNSANFGIFHHQDLVDLPASCDAATVTVDGYSTQTGDWRVGNKQGSPQWWVLGQFLGRHQPLVKAGSSECNTGASNAEPTLLREDFEDWHWVTMRRPTAGEEPTRFYDVDNLRTTDELVLRTPRVGFFSTPGFWGTWPNNEDNSARVSINQTLIVALGKSFEGVAVSNFSPDNVDAEHAAPDTECYGCHQTMDPMREFMLASFTNSGHEQLDPERSQLVADFVFDGVQTSGNGIEDLSQILADHPAFPYAWANKLCYYANAAPCPSGAELDRVVNAFVASELDFRVLVRELFSSPIVTGSECVDGVDSGSDAVISRQGQFCANLSNRLGVVDICGLETLTDPSNLQEDVGSAVISIPEDGFSRAVVEPIVISETGLFTRANREAACVLVAEGAYGDAYAGVAPEDAILDMVTNVMGLPESDPRHDGALAILQSHHAEAFIASQDEFDALQSTLALACMSPGSAGVGF